MRTVFQHNPLTQILKVIASATVFLLLSGMSATAQSSDWKKVEDAMGRSGQMQPGGVFKFSMPRKDLHVSRSGVEIKPALALGSWVAFKQEGERAWSWVTSC